MLPVSHLHKNDLTTEHRVVRYRAKAALDAIVSQPGYAFTHLDGTLVGRDMTS